MHTEFPSLAFIGLCRRDVPFKQFACQVKFTLAAWEGTFALPSADVMTDGVTRDVALRQTLGWPPHAAHDLGPLMKSYQDDLATLGRFQPYPQNFYDVLNVTVELLHLGLFYKNIQIKKTETGLVDMENLRELSEKIRKEAGLTGDDVEKRLSQLRRI